MECGPVIQMGMRVKRGVAERGELWGKTTDRSSRREILNAGSCGMQVQIVDTGLKDWATQPAAKRPRVERSDRWPAESSGAASPWYCWLNMPKLPTIRLDVFYRGQKAHQRPISGSETPDMLSTVPI